MVEKSQDMGVAVRRQMPGGEKPGMMLVLVFVVVVAGMDDGSWSLVLSCVRSSEIGVPWGKRLERTEVGRQVP